MHLPELHALLHGADNVEPVGLLPDAVPMVVEERPFLELLEQLLSVLHPPQLQQVLGLDLNSPAFEGPALQVLEDVLEEFGGFALLGYRQYLAGVELFQQHSFEG